jgi:hypothetical protein
MLNQKNQMLLTKIHLPILSDVSDSEEADSCEEMVACEEDQFADCTDEGDSDSLADLEAQEPTN